MRKIKKNFFVVITGPTGVGKTALVEELARISKHRFAVINGDMGQLYTPLSIGTAKPNLAQQTVDHYLFNVLNTPQNFTAYDYRLQVQACLEMLWNSNTLPVIVGGSGFYIRSLFFTPQSPTDNTNSKIQKTQQDYTKYTSTELWYTLNNIDSERAAHIKVQDRYRIIRALTIHAETGLLPSTLSPLYAPVGRALIVYITREKEELHTRIEQRIDSMFDNGWLEEVAQLPAVWHAFIQQKKIIGYPEISQYLATIHEKTQAREQLQELKNLIAQRTKAYAKRQQTFWRSFKQALTAQATCSSMQIQEIQEIQEINVTFTDLTVYTQQLECTLDRLWLS